MVRVPKLTGIAFRILESQPPVLIVTAKGHTPTLGWLHVQLLRRVYVTAPSDGFWEDDLFALPPSVPAGTQVTDVEASDDWKDYDSTSKGIRVFGGDKRPLEKLIK